MWSLSFGFEGSNTLLVPGVPVFYIPSPIVQFCLSTMSWFRRRAKGWRLKHIHACTETQVTLDTRMPRLPIVLGSRAAYIGLSLTDGHARALGSFQLEAQEKPLTCHQELMRVSCSSIGKQVVYSSRQRATENSGSECLQSPIPHITDALGTMWKTLHPFCYWVCGLEISVGPEGQLTWASGHLVDWM